MYPGPEKTQQKQDGIRWSVWPEDCGTGNDRVGTAAFRNKAAAFFVSSGGESGDRAAEVCVDSFLRRPSVKPAALQTIFGFANHVLMARNKPQEDFAFDAAACFLVKDDAAWLISGKAAILMFVDGKLEKRSPARLYPRLGVSTSYQAAADLVFPMPKQCRERIALFLCTGVFADELDCDRIARSLADDTGAWLKDAALPPDSAALAAFLPPKKGFPLFKLFAQSPA